MLRTLKQILKNTLVKWSKFLSFINKILFIVVTFIFLNQLFGKENLRQKYPDGLLTDDFSILSEADLIHDINNGNSRPYKIKEMQPGYYRWQCFPTKDVAYRYDTWKNNDPMGSSEIIVSLCMFGVHVKSKKLQHLYVDRRARRLEFCQELNTKWKKLTKDQTYLCLNGEPHGLEGSEVSWTWNKIKTHKGCASLFGDDCDPKK